MPDVGLGVGLLVVAAALLVGGAELFVENLAGAAARLRLSVVAVAVLLAGAEPEEALTSALASAETITELQGVEPLRRRLHARAGLHLAVVKIEPRNWPRALPPRDGVFVKNRFRQALGHHPS